MKKLFFGLLLTTPAALMAQIGIKAGPNFAKVGNASDINSSNKSGFHIGLLLGAPSKKILSSRTEFLFSRQGYDYKRGTTTGDVKLDYLQFGQLMSVNITKYVSLLLGAQTAYLITAKVDSTNNGSSGANNSIMKAFNRFDYGYALGAELHPLKGLLIGTRYNISLNKLFESVQTGQRPSFTSENAKNNVVQIYLGWRFGKTSEQKK